MPEVLELRTRRSGPALVPAFSALPPQRPLPMPSGIDTGQPETTPETVPSTVFDRCWRQYAICREYLFTDHTHHIASALRPMLDAPGPRYLVEAGCGPGFYSRRLATQFPQLNITGIDLSEPLLCRAQQRARRSGLKNCSFLKADALSLADFPGQVDAVIASRFFLILDEPASALAAIFTALRPGGLCFIAEPASALRASLPLLLMRFTERLGRSPAPLEQLPQSRVFTETGFKELIASQPWTKVRIWKDRQYHCAVCTKAA